ncbi:unnamed protein product [Timema podura]|uniref:tRNA:m(4)X modification enzyme TRM13 n=1 Tax=Timema podura TaxID=61482 RepID=A0ABN7NLQ7_TIMPD|nr:unnamed protein product [Timema podura]
MSGISLVKLSRHHWFTSHRKVTVQIPGECTEGQLSYWLGAALHDRKECMLLLVDRASHRHKFDNRFKGVVHPHVCRVRTDIADLCLNNYDQVNAFENVVTVAKHLCGAATVALPVLTENWLLLLWHFVVIIDEHGFTPAEFGVLCGIVSWATCGSGRSRSSISSENGLNERYIRLNLTQEDRKDIGRACKLILDFGRLQFLKEHSFSGNLVFYQQIRLGFDLIKQN